MPASSRRGESRRGESRRGGSRRGDKSPARSSSPARRVSNDAHKNWLNSHQLEGDGLLHLLYHHLWKKNKQFQSCPGARIPDTVVYEHNFPRAWYRYEAKNQEIVKLSGRFLDTSHICNSFSQPVEGTDVVAKFLFSAEDEQTGRWVTSVEYFTKDALFIFLNLRKERPDGILQRFVSAKTKHNSQIQAIWSPRVTMVQRRSNKHSLDDKLVSPYERCVTFDGPSHYSEDKLCAQQSQDQIRKLCLSFVDHFHSTDHKTITRMVIFFKVDHADNVWLLWCNSLRIAPPKFQTNTRRLPLNLAPHFVAPSGHSGLMSNDKGLAKVLSDTDALQFGLSNDVLFARSLVVGQTPKARGAFPKLSLTKAKATSPTSDSTAKLPEVARPLTCPLPETFRSFSESETTPSVSRPRPVPDDLHVNNVSFADLVEPAASLPRPDSKIEAQRQQLQRGQGTVEATMDDVLYGMAGHWAQRDKGEFVVSSPLELLQDVITQGELDELMESLTLTRSARDEEEVYVCPKVKGPLAHLEFQLRKVMDAIFKEKFQLLNGDHEGLQGSGMQGPGVGLPTVPVWGQSSSASAASCDMLQSLEQPLVGSLGEDGWGPGQAEL